MRILWVEDERHLRTEGAAYLRQEGFEVEEAGSAAEALQKLSSGSAELVLLDWMLPDASGTDVCRRIQTERRLPVIMVTAKADEFDKVLALEIGADDYIVKPFGMRELAARIRAVARRSGTAGTRAAGPEDADVSRQLVRGALRISEERHAAYLHDRQLPLTPTEFALLCALARRPGQVFTRDQLMETALGDSFVGFERTIDSHIRNLRRKLGDAADEPAYILTVFGVGYKFGDVFNAAPR